MIETKWFRPPSPPDRPSPLVWPKPLCPSSGLPQTQAPAFSQLLNCNCNLNVKLWPNPLHLLPSLFITDNLAVLLPLPSGHYRVSSMVGSPPKRFKIRNSKLWRTSLTFPTLLCLPALSCPWYSVASLLPLYMDPGAQRKRYICEQRSSLTNLMAGPVDGVVQWVPLRSETFPQLWISPLFLKLGQCHISLSCLNIECYNLPPAQKEQWSPEGRSRSIPLTTELVLRRLATLPPGWRIWKSVLAPTGAL